MLGEKYLTRRALPPQVTVENSYQTEQSTTLLGVRIARDELPLTCLNVSVLSGGNVEPSLLTKILTDERYVAGTVCHLARKVVTTTYCNRTATQLFVIGQYATDNKLFDSARNCINKPDSRTH